MTTPTTSNKTPLGYDDSEVSLCCVKNQYFTGFSDWSILVLKPLDRLIIYVYNNNSEGDVPQEKKVKEKTMNAVKGTFEYQGQVWNAYWNGKNYGDTKYITVSRPGGSEVKVTASQSKGLSAGGSRSLDFAKAAYKSITSQDW